MSFFKALQLYNRLNPFLDAYKKEFSMKLSTNVIVQVLATTIQTLNALVDFVPPKMKIYIAAAVGILQAIVGLLAHYAEPPTPKP